MVSYRVKAAAFGMIVAFGMAACAAADGLAAVPRAAERRRRSRREGPGARLAGGRTEDSLGAAGRPGLRRRGDLRRQRVPARPRGDTGRRAPPVQPGRRKGSLALHLRRARRALITTAAARRRPPTETWCSASAPSAKSPPSSSATEAWCGRRTCWRTGAPTSRSGRVSTSPLLYGDWVIMMPWGKKAALVAYEKATGKVVWTTPNPKASRRNTSRRSS